MDRATARNFVALKVEDPDFSRFTQTAYNNALDLAQQQFSIDARAIIKETSLTTVAGTSTVALPSDFLVCVLVRHKGLKLTPTTPYELSFQSGQDWTTLPNGTPTGFYIDAQNQNIVLVPTPDAQNAGANLTLDYVAVPAALSLDSSTLLGGNTIIQYYTPAVVAWAARELLSYVPLTQEILIKRQELLKEYERYKNEAITTYNNMSDQPIRMGGGRYWQDNVVRPKSNAFSDS